MVPIQTTSTKKKAPSLRHDVFKLISIPRTVTKGVYFFKMIVSIILVYCTHRLTGTFYLKAQQPTTITTMTRTTTWVAMAFFVLVQPVAPAEPKLIGGPSALQLQLWTRLLLFILKTNTIAEILRHFSMAVGQDNGTNLICERNGL